MYNFRFHVKAGNSEMDIKASIQNPNSSKNRDV